MCNKKTYSNIIYGHICVHLIKRLFKKRTYEVDTFGQFWTLQLTHLDTFKIYVSFNYMCNKQTDVNITFGHICVHFIKVLFKNRTQN